MIEFKKIEEFPNYWITKTGAVWSYKRSIWLKPRKNNHNRLMVVLRKDRDKYIQIAIVEDIDFEGNLDIAGGYSDFFNKTDVKEIIKGLQELLED